MNEELTTTQAPPVTEKKPESLPPMLTRDDMIREVYCKMGKLDAHLDFALKLIQPTESLINL